LVNATNRLLIKASTKPLLLNGDPHRWHTRYGHISYKVLAHLKDVVQGVDIVPQVPEEELRQETCEVCQTAVSNRQISRRDARRTTRLFKKVYFDLIRC
jgi:hypothetical protein